VFGWAKPVPVRMDRLNNPRFGMMAVGAAGPAVNIVLALLTAVVLGLLARMATGSPDMLPELLLQGLITFIRLNVFLALFNLLPIPPFEGSHIVQGLLPERLGEAYGRLQRYGMVVFALLVAVTWLAPQLGLIDMLVGVPFNWVMERMIGLSTVIAGQ
jgi:Zn-dependent protease